MPNAFAVDNAEFVDFAFAAKLYVIKDNWFHIPGTKGVEIENAVDWERNWNLGTIIHVN